MGILEFLGNALLSIAYSIIGNMIDRLMQSRAKEKSSTVQSKSS